MPSRRHRGLRAEELVVGYLRERGFRIVDRNVRTQLGELDIIAYDDGILCFVEVRSRADAELGSPAETVTEPKRRRLRRLAEAYLDRKRLDVPARFDVASVILADPPTIEYIADAFE